MVYQIMNKCVAFAAQGKPLGITGAVAGQSKGKIYIKSMSKPSVLKAVQGIRGLMLYTMKLVPIKDMTTILNVKPKKKPGEYCNLLYYSYCIHYNCITLTFTSDWSLLVTIKP